MLGDRMGWDAFWTVEHHFLEEFSHCSNPEVLYGAVAAQTTNLRIGYGVRLAPKPYNHPVRSAESAAVLDLLSDGRVDFGTGRSATRHEIEGFGIDPADTRDMWKEAIRHVVGCWTNDSTVRGPVLVDAAAGVLPKPFQKPHPPCGGAGSPKRTTSSGRWGSTNAVRRRHAARRDRAADQDHREGIAACREPVMRSSTIAPRFWMVNCAPTRRCRTPSRANHSSGTASTAPK
jgi:alkanesulfonate monooxygenase SsuD/methylene tetrahydromethanopterin reductase-like flavin-dependent oxidoreductase (luciferase family)